MMTADDLRQDADHREMLTRIIASEKTRWSASGRRVTVMIGTEQLIADCYLTDEARFIAAHDPQAALASCKRDRLLADCIEALDAPQRDAVPLARDGLLTRFAALKVPT